MKIISWILTAILGIILILQLVFTIPLPNWMGSFGTFIHKWGFWISIFMLLPIFIGLFIAIAVLERNNKSIGTNAGASAEVFDSIYDIEEKLDDHSMRIQNNTLDIEGNIVNIDRLDKTIDKIYDNNMQVSKNIDKLEGYFGEFKGRVDNVEDLARKNSTDLAALEARVEPVTPPTEIRQTPPRQLILGPRDPDYSGVPAALELSPDVALVPQDNGPPNTPFDRRIISGRQRFVPARQPDSEINP
jgi:hypothetical protein